VKLEEHFGPGRFMVGTICKSSENPHGKLAVAVGKVIDMNAEQRSRSTALGALLRGLPEVEVVAELCGSSIYRQRSDYIVS
jgi:hypothetical protein